MFKTIIVSLIVSFTLAVTGCRTLDAAVKIEVQDIKTQVVTKLNSNEVNSFVKALQSKQAVMVKKMPEFEKLVSVIGNENKSEKWYYAPSGFVMSFDKKNSQVYRIKLDGDFIL